MAICTDIQRDGGAIVHTVNRAKPSKEELAGIFAESITSGMPALTDGLRSYNARFSLVFRSRKEISTNLFST